MKAFRRKEWGGKRKKKSERTQMCSQPTAGVGGAWAGPNIKMTRPPASNAPMATDK